MKHDDILAAARERMAEAYSSDEENRGEAAQDLRFVIGKGQWPEDVRRARESEGKPCLTINGLPQYLRQVTAQIRGMNPAIKVSPSDQIASSDVADIYEGIIRHIEAKCDAQSVYESAAESAAACGIGHWRVRTDYCHEYTFDQEILIEPIYNSFSVFTDPLAKHPTRKDARYRFIAEEMAKEEFARLYPDATPADLTTDHRIPGYEYWTTADTVTVAEYFWIENRKVKLGLLPDGRIVENPKPPLQYVKERMADVPQVKWAKVTAHDVLEGPVDIPGKYIPVFTVTGEEIHIGEERYRSSVVRYAKDPQMLYNYARSANAEVVALQPKAPYIITAKQVAGLETFWNEANNSNRPYLPYNPDPEAPPPQRSQPPVSSSGLMTEVSLAAEDMKRTTGIYDAALGARSNETSGIAIQERKMEAQNSNSIYADNLVKAIRHCGRVIVDMIPHVYDTRRVVQIVGSDDQEEQVVINDLMMSETGPVMVNDLRQGRYDVNISVGPSYSTRRQEASQGMMEFLRVVPQAGAVTADLVAGAQEWPDSDKFAERLRKTLPPGLVEQEDPEAQQKAMMAQQAQAAEQARQEELGRIMQEIEMKKANAEAIEAEAKADRASYEAEEAKIKLAALQGGLQVGMVPQI